ncbi:tyrosine-protein phosphatase non-receptor type 9-like [Cotesia typhae]|uniref:tyrosine-protein phosphatase non-receptor type 9-like n=1 Tax=Cotesia typhae TaxID=2053667 RepID=UPI003D693BC9
MCSNVFGMYHISNYLEQVTESETKYIERICREHHVIINIQISGSCEECKKMENTKKNRFQNIECWDSTRVCLKKKGSNYIHANYVDGFEQVWKFIVTQEPMDNTLEDYWSMVWRTGARVIVMLNGTDGPAVPSVSDYNQLEGFTVTVTSIAVQKDYVEMGMNVLNINTMRSKAVHFFKYLSWPKEGITDISTLISFMIAVNERHQYYMKPALMNPPSPIVIYSTTGIERAPTFCAVDICIFQLVNSATISIPSVVFNIRQQRRSSFESLDHYVFINNVIVHFLATIPPNYKLYHLLFSRRFNESARFLSHPSTVNPFCCYK